MNRAYYSNSISQFLDESTQSIYGKLAIASEFTVEQGQKSAWIGQIEQLKGLLRGLNGSIYFEFSIPRMGKRVDVVLLIGQAIFVVEYKVGDSQFSAHAVDQVMDYCLDLKNFHATSHDRFIMPVLVATGADNLQRQNGGQANFSPGMVAGIQTFGELVHFHPHIHAIVTDGGFTPGGTFICLPRINTRNGKTGDRPILDPFRR